MTHTIFCERLFSPDTSEEEIDRCRNATSIVNLPSWAQMKVGWYALPFSTYKSNKWWDVDVYVTYDMDEYKKTKGLLYRLRLKVKALFRMPRTSGSMPVFEHTPAPPERTSSNCPYLTPPPCYQKTPYISDIMAAMDDKKPMEWVTIQRGASMGKTGSVIEPAIGYILHSSPEEIEPVATKTDEQLLKEYKEAFGEFAPDSIIKRTRHFQAYVLNVRVAETTDRIHSLIMPIIDKIKTKTPPPIPEPWKGAIQKH